MVNHRGSVSSSTPTVRFRIRPLNMYAPKTYSQAVNVPKTEYWDRNKVLSYQNITNYSKVVKLFTTLPFFRGNKKKLSNQIAKRFSSVFFEIKMQISRSCVGADSCHPLLKRKNSPSWCPWLLGNAGLARMP